MISDFEIGLAIDYIESNFSKISLYGSDYFNSDYRLIHPESFEKEDNLSEITWRNHSRALAERFYDSQGIRGASKAMRLTSLIYHLDIPSVESIIQISDGESLRDYHSRDDSFGLFLN